MQAAANGVRFESKDQGWKAVLPAGPYLPEEVVLERGPLGLSAHFQEPIDRLTLSCKEEEDGLVRVSVPGNWQKLLFRPDTQEYGIESGFAGWVRQETRLPDGSLHFRAMAGEHLHEAVQTPDGKVEATSRQAGKVGHGARVTSRQVEFLPVLSLAESVAEKGLLAGLWSCASAQFNTPVSFALQAGGSDLRNSIQSAREESRERARVDTDRLLRPPSGNAVELGSHSVVLAGIRLRTATRI